MGEPVLVVRRRTGEAIVIGGEIEVEVIEISRTRVKLGVVAPRSVAVTRREAVAIAEQNRRASALIAVEGNEGIGKLLKQISLAGQMNAQKAVSSDDKYSE